MIYILFVAYCVLFCWLIPKISFFKKSGLTPRILLSLFIFRIFVSIIGCYLNVYYLPVSDSVFFHNMSVKEYHLLFQNPYEYLVNIFETNSPEAYSRLLDSSDSFWNNIRTNLIVKMLSIFDIFSFKSFLINTLFFNFLIFFGCVALYKVFNKIFPGAYSPLIFCIFLFPSTLFYTAMIHRDGLIFLSISMIIYYIFFFAKNDEKRTWAILKISLFIFLVFLLRNFVFIALIPALIAWILAKKFPKKTSVIFAVVYSMSAIVFFTSSYISPRASLPQYVSSRQSSFIEIGKNGGSTFNVDPLEPTFKGFLKKAPEAINHSVMRPYLSEIKTVDYIPFAIEILIFDVIFVLLIFFKRKDLRPSPLTYFCIFFSITNLLMIGYTIPILGAIVRYRSIYLLFLIIPVVCYIDWKRLSVSFNIKYINI